jgi:hypothetical protein
MSFRHIIHDYGYYSFRLCIELNGGLKIPCVIRNNADNASMVLAQSSGRYHEYTGNVTST